MQHYETKCNTCANSKTNAGTCNTVDLVIGLFFNPSKPNHYHYLPGSGVKGAATYQWFDFPNKQGVQSSERGLNGVIFMNFYGGISYLSDLRYLMPPLHCTNSIKLAAPSNTNKVGLSPFETQRK